MFFLRPICYRYWSSKWIVPLTHTQWMKARSGLSSATLNQKGFCQRFERCWSSALSFPFVCHSSLPMCFFAVVGKREIRCLKLGWKCEDPSMLPRGSHPPLFRMVKYEWGGEFFMVPCIKLQYIICYQLWIKCAQKNSINLWTKILFTHVCSSRNWHLYAPTVSIWCPVHSVRLWSCTRHAWVNGNNDELLKSSRGETPCTFINKRREYHHSKASLLTSGWKSVSWCKPFI